MRHAILLILVVFCCLAGPVPAQQPEADAGAGASAPQADSAAVDADDSGETADGASASPESAEAAARPPERFDPSEEISADTAVAFPVDI